MIENIGGNSIGNVEEKPIIYDLDDSSPQQRNSDLSSRVKKNLRLEKDTAKSDKEKDPHYHKKRHEEEQSITRLASISIADEEVHQLNFQSVTLINTKFRVNTE